MGTAKRVKRQTLMREVRPEMTQDQTAANQLSFNTGRKTAKKNPKDAAPNKKEQRRALLYGSQRKDKHKRELLRKQIEKDLPSLNRAVVPGLKLKRGKKGKKFVADHDSIILERLVKTVGDKQDQVDESKLEKSRRLEEIRDLKRKELERKEQEKQNKLDDKKNELKKTSSVARTMRRKNKRVAEKEAQREEEDLQKSKSEKTAAKKAKKSVSFA
ncbi:60S ribosomal subunit assembly/export protein LOC1 [Hanseniaspora osmophila]|uniref:60S ribosomal subunit assembly/export protein LOC1 n=1 Tax=Hanseniaspora osmophila TaxID=56408 RepID=A0A1E5RFQ5_9ASCO|nr:60S ribosomal subunit assembly/export protein LOC1 [Hanseniaspora osmophila]